MKLRSIILVLLLYVSLCLILALLIETDYTNSSYGSSYLKTEAGLNLEELVKRNGMFQEMQENQYSLGYFSEDLWIRLDIPQDTTGRVLEINKPAFALTDFYFPLNDGTISHINKSEKLSFRTQSTLIPENISFNKPAYIRLQTPLAFNFELRFWDVKPFMTYILKDYIFFGIIYGILLSIVIYNMILFVILKKSSYLYFLLFGLGTILWCMITYGHIELFVTIPGVYQNRVSLPVVSLIWFNFASFMGSFLKTRIMTPKLHNIIITTKIMAVILCFLGILGFTNAGHLLDTALSYILPPFAIYISILCLKKGFQSSFWFLSGWLLFLVGTVIYALAGGLIPRNSLTLNLFASGAALSSLLLSYALADEVRILQSENSYLNCKSRSLKKISLTDNLTRLHNRASFNENLKREISRARQIGHPLALIMIDVDLFKRFNDTWGHLEGDKVLMAMGPLLSQGIRDQDFACRYGGEEFALILPGTNKQKAMETAERIRKKMEETEFPISCSDEIEHLTISLGIAVYIDIDDILTLTERADQALYRAKNLGRNRVCSS
ncbi:diguanylate cyclase [Oceanispirochaeta crateris]|uniref:diguanylate cyclase n=1 Tax=Oceanispirochaeta crateris TaxID=2518645 RepID=A0A5C1QFC2_9SPIO|nr:GGDEF domain-containing protein [Oceanispirochaeta crateris]QEN06735.1 diguanylate cyclase [Oceanispirochaeta crateris]